MNKYFKFAKRLSKDEEGATAIEYGLLAALIAVALITVLGTVQGALEDNFDEIATELNDAIPAGQAPAPAPGGN